jgi:hypothetical protein
VGRESEILRFSIIFVSVRWRFDAFLVDRREGPLAESSRTKMAFLRSARFDSLCGTVGFRSVALTPGFAVFTGKSRRGRRGFGGCFGPDRSASQRNRSAFVAMSASSFRLRLPSPSFK